MSKPSDPKDMDFTALLKEWLAFEEANDKGHTISISRWIKVEEEINQRCPPRE
jgi:hypothetical protein